MLHGWMQVKWCPVWHQPFNHCGIVVYLLVHALFPFTYIIQNVPFTGSGGISYSTGITDSANKIVSSSLLLLLDCAAVLFYKLHYHHRGHKVIYLLFTVILNTGLSCMRRREWKEQSLIEKRKSRQTDRMKIQTKTLLKNKMTVVAMLLPTLSSPEHKRNKHMILLPF